MRIGIVTFYSECNYGAFLQALGSKKVLESMGHDVTFINFNPAKDSSFLLKLGLHDGTFSRKVARRYKIYFKYKLKPYCKPYLDAFARARHDFFAETEKVEKNRLGELAERFDCIYVGSDQVWNTRNSGSERLFYFLDFFKSGATRKVSYAACFGQLEQNAALEADVRKCLADFDAISVRNDVSQQLVERYTGRRAPIVCDPTVLLGDFSFAESNCADTLGDYTLFYCLDERQRAKHEKMVELLRQKYNRPVLTITSSHHTAWTITNADTTVYDASPSDWLALMSHARSVYTDSFHGAIFALLYHKSLIIMADDNERAYRLRDASQRYGIADKFCTTVDEAIAQADVEIDFPTVDRLLADHRAKSTSFLNDALR